MADWAALQSSAVEQWDVWEGSTEGISVPLGTRWL